ncbi:hypothetical protein FHS04_002061 [Mesoflavibacter sabulilitoris]|uniref:Uncharacterized protein n=1 Tax=Mesoflavibacter zeaxanthinifaciens subsp. sabulilitoris TaxID=1520893 RepID=A0A2T1NM12_9FLAO|nr:hypothetical protein [Mesoflavibacter zeaxanthinifaciens]MBB3124538.1 hypothetical protein [Mesoflavibacter zeaxanthinifaciens subsp. sabulilitoris]PSG93906.1 hypothetical protein C7H61_01665 [Mesoflavibacter zeaxanthinifaciens subsp. sabulilitoris]
MKINEHIKLTSKRAKFIKTYSDFDDHDTLKELLYTHQLQLDKLERIRSNTSMLVWWLVAIPIIFGILIFIFGAGKFFL